MDKEEIKEKTMSNKRPLEDEGKDENNNGIVPMCKDKTVSKNKRPFETKVKEDNQSIPNIIIKKTKLESNKKFEILPGPVWDRLSLFLPFNIIIQASFVCKEWRQKLKPYLWKNPSSVWLNEIIRDDKFIEGIQLYKSDIRKLENVNVAPSLLIKAVELCHNLEALAINCSHPIAWKDEQIVQLLSIEHLKFKLKHLAIFNISQQFSLWKPLSNVISKMKSLSFLTLPVNFPYDTNFECLPICLKFLNCNLDKHTYNNLIQLNLNHFIGLTINFDMEWSINLETLLPKLKKLTTLSLQGKGYINKIHYLCFPKLLTGLKININCNKEDLLNLLRKTKNLKHVEFSNVCCDDRVLTILLRQNHHLQVLSITNSSITTSGVASIFKSSIPLRVLNIECHHENCGPFNFELDKCTFISKLTDLNVSLSLYLSVKILKGLKYMKSLVNFKLKLNLTQLGNIDCHSIFNPTLPYLSFFPIPTQLDYLVSNWKHYFKTKCYSLTSFFIIFNGNPHYLDMYKSKFLKLFKESLINFPCVHKPRFIYINQTIFPEFCVG